MAKAISELPFKTSLVDADEFTILDSQDAALDTKNKRITKAFAFAGYATDASVNLVQSNLDTHIADLGNPHGVTQAQVGLGNVDNTSDLDKPVSTATQAALDAKVNHAPNDGQHKLRLYQSWVNAGDTALKNVGTGANDVAAGDAPAAAVASHESLYTHTNIPTNTQKSALDAAASPSAGNPFATIADTQAPTPPEGTEIRSTGIQAGYRLSADGDGTSSWQPPTDISGKVDTSTQVLAGSQLTGGGALSSDVTLNLAVTTVTPGVYTMADITVDQYGRVTAAADGGPDCGLGGAIGCFYFTESDPTGFATVKNGDFWVPVAPGPVGPVYIRNEGAWVDLLSRANHTGDIINAKLVGYEEELNVNNLGVFDLTSANFFVCTPTSDITLAPSAGSLTVCSATVHVINDAGRIITMPLNHIWVGAEPILPPRYALTMYTLNGGSDWYLTYVGEIP